MTANNTIMPSKRSMFLALAAGVLLSSARLITGALSPGRRLAPGATDVEMALWLSGFMIGMRQKYILFLAPVLVVAYLAMAGLVSVGAWQEVFSSLSAFAVIIWACGLSGGWLMGSTLRYGVPWAMGRRRPGVSGTE